VGREVFHVRVVRRGRRAGRVPRRAAASGGAQATTCRARSDDRRSGHRAEGAPGHGVRLGVRQDRAPPAGAGRLRPTAGQARGALPRTGRRGRAHPGHCGAGHVHRRARPGGTGLRGCGHDCNREHGAPCPCRRCSGGRPASSAYHQAGAVDFAPPRCEEGSPGRHPGGRRRPALRERAAGRRRRRGRAGAGVLHRRPGPRGARQEHPGPGRLAHCARRSSDSRSSPGRARTPTR
jgi:hypothetical protein